MKQLLKVVVVAAMMAGQPIGAQAGIDLDNACSDRRAEQVTLKMIEVGMLLTDNFTDHQRWQIDGAAYEARLRRISGRLTFELKVTDEDGEDVLFKDNLGNGRPLDEINAVYRDISREEQLRYCRALGRLVGGMLQ